MLILKKKSRSEFKKPLGKLYPSIKELIKDLKENNRIIISIGDVTTINLQKAGIIPDIGIVDNKIERKEVHYKDIIDHDYLQLNSQNPPGTITKNMWGTIQQAIQLIGNSKYHILIMVDGEEDLAVIPSVIMAPQNSIVIYGQPGKGVVFCEVDQVKNKVKKLLNEFVES